jgi:hypothetical protein
MALPSNIKNKVTGLGVVADFYNPRSVEEKAGDTIIKNKLKKKVLGIWFKW